METGRGVGRIPTYFNDNEPFVLPWLGNLYPGAHVDGRSIVDVQPEDLKGYQRVHHFAGIGGWEYALQLAGWPEDVPVWTGSCPCQPFSTAGKRGGTSDERHLWPELARLIAECRPPVVFGEQVASKLGREWLSGVRADLEALGYAVGAADLCAAGVGAPHIRQRLYWVAYSGRWSSQRGSRSGEAAGEARPAQGQVGQWERGGDDAGVRSSTDGVAYPERLSREPGWTTDQSRESAGAQGTGAPVEPRRRGDTGGVGDTHDPRPQGLLLRRDGTHQCFTRPSGLGAWGEYDLVECADGQTRRFEPGSFPLAPRLPGDVGRIRAYGGAIVPQAAAVFVRSFMEAVGL